MMTINLCLDNYVLYKCKRNITYICGYLIVLENDVKSYL